MAHLCSMHVVPLICFVHTFQLCAVLREHFMHNLVHSQQAYRCVYTVSMKQAILPEIVGATVAHRGWKGAENNENIYRKRIYCISVQFITNDQSLDALASLPFTFTLPIKWPDRQQPKYHKYHESINILWPRVTVDDWGWPQAPTHIQSARHW